MKALLIALVVGGCEVAVATAPVTPSRGDGLRAFEVVRGVLQHPRCQNCRAGAPCPG